MTLKRSQLFFFLVLTIIITLFLFAVFEKFWGEWRCANEPLHSTIEAIGGIIAILTGILLINIREKGFEGKFFLIAVGFIGMGILAEFHALVSLGKGLVWLHRMSTLTGGFFFFLILFLSSYFSRDSLIKGWLPWLTGIGGFLLGFWTILDRDFFPEMTVDGKFTLTASILTIISGTFFVLSSVVLLKDYSRTLKIELYLLGFISALFGVADMLFIFSEIWDNTWWMWHVIRLSAYGIAFAYMVSSFYQTNKTMYKTTRSLKMISGCNEILIRSRDEKELFKLICDNIINIGGYRFTWIGFAQNDERKTIKPIAYSGFEDGYLEKIDVSYADTERGRGPSGIAIRTGKPAIIKNTQADHNYALWQVDANARGYFSVIAFPLSNSNSVFGALSIYSSESDAFDEKEVKLLTELANDLSYGITALRNVSARTKAEDELQKLNKELEQKITERTKELENISSYTRNLIEASIDPLVTVNPDGKITDVNKAMELVTGLPRGKLIGTNFSECFTEPEKTREGFRQVLTQGFVKDYPLAIRHSSGIITDVLYHATIFTDKKGNVAGVFASARDITERKRIEEEIRKLNESLRKQNLELDDGNRKLEVVNKELEAFSYSVSHDLRAPLRTIDGFSQILLEDYSGRFDEQGRDYLNRIRAGSNRMAQLIDDILKLSRISRAEMHKEKVSLSSIAQTVADELRKNTPARDVDVVIASGIEAEGDSHLLRIVFENLLGNAWKFTGRNESAKIEVGKMVDNGERVCFVRDNGAGFDMKYADKLFGAFQRLHGEKEFSGTGIGLATVQRIINRHGGRIWAESEIEKGATFYFTLPR